MEALTLLHGRVSVPADALEDPAPDGAHLEAILRAGVSAPDHGGLRPWRFLLIRGEARHRLGETFAAALAARNPASTAEDLARQRSKPLRAPLIIAVIARIDPDNPKIPEIEQILSAGAAAHQMQLAANALGYGSVWLTGPNTRDASVAEALGLDFDDRVVALLHMGTPRHGFPERDRPAPSAFVSEWHEPQQLETL